MSRPGLSRRFGATALLAALLAVPFAGLAVVATTQAAGAAITNYADGSIGTVGGMTSGPDGALWFTNRDRNTIGRMDLTTHYVSTYGGTGISQPAAITDGPDGALWFTNTGNNSIGRINPSTHAVTNYTGSGIDHPTGITAGPTGDPNSLWFTNQGNNSIGRITTGGATSNFSNPFVSTPGDIVSGPDGALWFVNTGLDSIGRVDTGGSFNIYAIGSGAAPAGIAVGSDGALWATNHGNNKITRMDTDGNVTNVYTGAAISSPSGITLGADGALWFANTGNGTIGRIDTSGNLTSYSGNRLNPTLITLGSDNALWFTNPGFSNVIGRIAESGTVTKYNDATISTPGGIATGSDNAMWFTNHVGNSIGRIDPVTHAVTSYTGPGISNPSSIALGPDGAMWFTNFGAPGSIGRIDMSGTVTNYTGSPNISGPLGITAGPDGAMWFTNDVGNSIGRIDVVTHTATSYGDPSIDGPAGIAAGPDGKLWFANQGSGSGSSIGRITTDGSTIDNFPDAGIMLADAITAGPDGAMWFTDYGSGGSGAIGRIDTSGNITLYPDAGIIGPSNITTGSDGALWFANTYGSHNVGRIDPTTHAITYVTHPSIIYPLGIASGPDGAIWFTDQGDNTVGQLTMTAGDVTRFGGPGPNAPGAITAGSDGAMWFVNGEDSSISRMATAGFVTNNYPVASAFRLTAGPDGALWFTDSENNRIGRLTTSGVVTYYGAASISNPTGIAAGSDGALWFTNRDSNSIGRIDPTTHVVTNYTDAGIDQPFDIVAGPDGALWFDQNLSGNSIGRIDTSGNIAMYSDANFAGGVGGLAAGPDGGLWVARLNGAILRVDPSNGSVTDTFTGPNISGPFGLTLGTDGAFYYFTASGSQIGRITTAGTATAQVDPNMDNPSSMAAGPDNAVWYTNSSNNSIGRADSPGVAGAPTNLAPTAGNGQIALSWTAPANNGGFALTNYAVSVFNSAGGAATGVTGATTRLVGSTATSYAFTGLTNGTGYTFKVGAVNSAGTGTLTPLSEVQTPGPFNVPARSPGTGSNGYDTGYTVTNAVRVGATGSWCWIDSPPSCTGPDGPGFTPVSGFLLNAANSEFALVGRIGTTGAWTLIGSGPVTLSGNGRLYLAMNDQVGQFGDDMGAIQVSLDALNGVTGTNPPVSAQISAGYDAAWSVPIVNDGNTPLTGVTATLHANANGPVPLVFHDSLMAGCVAGGGHSEVCTVGTIPAHSTYLLNAYVPTSAGTNNLGNGRTITGTVAVSASAGLSASGSLGPVTVLGCGSSCVQVVAPPGVPVSNSPPPATPAAPPQQTVTLPAVQSGAKPAPVAVKLSTITPSPSLPLADQKLCPTAPGQTRCSGKISSVVANFTKFKDPVHPIKVTIKTNWGSKVPTGRILMEKDSGGDPLFLLACHRASATAPYNVPCVMAETVTGTAAASNLTTTNSILLTGVDVHFARRTAGGGTIIKAPVAPTAVTATPGATKATVKWKAPTVTNGAGVTSYTVTVLAGAVVKKTIAYASPALTQTIAGLTNGTAYTFKVAAGNVAGKSVASTPSAAVKVGVPLAPTAVRATAGHASVSLQWTAPAANGTTPITAYVVTPYVGTVAKPARTLAGTARTAVVAGLVTGTTYTFKVAAKNSIGTGPVSAASNPAKVT